MEELYAEAGCKPVKTAKDTLKKAGLIALPIVLFLGFMMTKLYLLGGAAVLAAAGAVLADVWVEGVTMPVIDNLGDEFLEYVKDGMKITVKEDGTVIAE